VHAALSLRRCVVERQSKLVLYPCTLFSTLLPRGYRAFELGLRRTGLRRHALTLRPVQALRPDRAVRPALAASGRRPRIRASSTGTFTGFSLARVCLTPAQYPPSGPQRLREAPRPPDWPLWAMSPLTETLRRQRTWGIRRAHARRGWNRQERLLYPHEVDSTLANSPGTRVPPRICGMYELFGRPCFASGQPAAARR
jgi:hypothetical protein